ncbi:hypothetical protein ACOME3_009049 [Neoechinorhynchus agilis]
MIASQETANAAEEMEKRVSQASLKDLRAMSEEFGNLEESVKRQAVGTLTASERTSLSGVGFLKDTSQDQGFRSGNSLAGRVSSPKPSRGNPGRERWLRVHQQHRL